MSCIRTIQMMAVQPIIEADAPAFAHGETAERPIPAPNARSASDKAAATNAPAMTAPQDTPELFESFATIVSLIVDRSIGTFLRASICFNKKRRKPRIDFLRVDYRVQRAALLAVSLSDFLVSTADSPAEETSSAPVAFS